MAKKFNIPLTSIAVIETWYNLFYPELIANQINKQGGFPLFHVEISGRICLWETISKKLSQCTMVEENWTTKQPLSSVDIKFLQGGLYFL